METLIVVAETGKRTLGSRDTLSGETFAKSVEYLFNTLTPRDQEATGFSEAHWVPGVYMAELQADALTGEVTILFSSIGILKMAEGIADAYGPRVRTVILTSEDPLPTSSRVTIISKYRLYGSESVFDLCRRPPVTA